MSRNTLSAPIGRSVPAVEVITMGRGKGSPTITAPARSSAGPEHGDTSIETEERKNPSATPDTADGTQAASEADSGPEKGSSETDEMEQEEDDIVEELPLDQVFEILKNKRRREVLHYLEEHDGNASLSDLAEHIAAIENDTTVKAISSTQRKRVYVGLYQCHLPKMDDMDIVDFDKNRGTVELAKNAEQVKAYLGESDEPAWYKMYLGLALGGGLLFLVAEAGTAQYGLQPSVILLTVLAGLTICAVAQAGGLDRIRADE